MNLEGKKLHFITFGKGHSHCIDGLTLNEKTIFVMVFSDTVSTAEINAHINKLFEDGILLNYTAEQFAEIRENLLHYATDGYKSLSSALDPIHIDNYIWDILMKKENENGANICL